MKGLAPRPPRSGGVPDGSGGVPPTQRVPGTRAELRVGGGGGLSCLAALLLFLLPCAASAQTLRPHVALINPSGGQRGTTVAFTINGPNLGYGTKLIPDDPGLTVESVQPEAPPANAKNPEGKLVARIKIAPDAPLGRHSFRIVTPFGPSDAGFLVVGEWPEVAEKEPNNTREQAQPLSGPVTVAAHSDGPEDVDVYRVTVAPGETMVFAATAGSFGSPMEPILTLKDSAGHERGFSAALSRSDAVLTFTAPPAEKRPAGTGDDYYLYVHDLRYQGGPPFAYRLTVGHIPWVTSVFPLGGPRGAKVRLAMNGVNLPNPAERIVALPMEEPATPYPLPDAGNFRIDAGTLPEINEVEKNDQPETAQKVTLPVTINGRIYSPFSPLPDVDCYRFTATKGEVIQMEVVAARLGSPLDAVLSVLDAKGKELASNDDAHGRDPGLTFTAPEAGDYIVRVRDLTGRAGENFGYRLYLSFPQPDYRIAFSPDCLAVGPGDRVPFTVTATRKNGADGDIPLSFTDLPAGMHLTGTPVILHGQNTVTLFATVDPGTAAAVLPLVVTGSAAGPGTKALVRRAESHEEIYYKNNDQVARMTRPAPLPLVAVTGAPDLIFSTEGNRLALTVGKTVQLKVRVQRRADFTAKIPIIVQGLPAGVSVSGSEIPEKVNEATLTFTAEGNAAVGEVTLTLLGRSVVDELHFSDHAALPVTLTVAK